MTSCPACSTALPPGARFCTHCSYSQTRCPFCNAHLPDPSGACLNCRRVSPSASRSVSSMPAAAPITSGYAQPNQQSYSMNVGMNLGVPQSMHQNFNFNQGMAMTQHAYRQPMIQQQAFPFGLPGSQDSNLLKTAGAGINSMQPKAFKQMSNQTFAGQSGAPKKLDSSHINPWIFANNGNGLALSSPKVVTEIVHPCLSDVLTGSNGELSIEQTQFQRQGRLKCLGWFVCHLPRQASEDGVCTLRAQVLVRRSQRGTESMSHLSDKRSDCPENLWMKQSSITLLKS
mmetsp:Transcript_21436/g.71008  ORF Transcript_21436/g.71008 Transcript_21436/m.71008 type:complete len:286 (-) Transcript_21436:239-1096(-)